MGKTRNQRRRISKKRKEKLKNGVCARKRKMECKSIHKVNIYPSIIETGVIAPDMTLKVSKKSLLDICIQSVCKKLTLSEARRIPRDLYPRLCSFLGKERSRNLLDYYETSEKYNNNCTIKNRACYKNGLLDGICMETNPSSKKIYDELWHYKNGKRNGVCQKWSKNKLVFECYYENNVLNGPYLERMKGDYNTILEESYYIRGKRHGICRLFDYELNETKIYLYHNGQIVENIIF